MDAKTRQVTVVMPKPDEDRPSWGRVGVIAAVGFIIGIAWPRIAGVKLGPNAPGETDKSQAAESASAVGAPPSANVSTPSAKASSTPLSANGTASASASAAAAEPSGPPDVTVANGLVLNCKNEDGESLKGKDCGKGPGFDGIALSRLRHLSQCSAAVGATGKLSVIFSLDFTNGGRLNTDVGKSSTVTNQDSITTCLKTEFYGVMLTNVSHEHPKYQIAYHVNFAPPSAAAATAAPADSAAPSTFSDASPTALIVWEVALVRDAPKTGNVASRLPRGSKVRLGTSKDGWYRVQYGNNFSAEGWLYRGAIGK